MTTTCCECRREHGRRRQLRPTGTYPYGQEPELPASYRLDFCPDCFAPLGTHHHRGCSLARCLLCDDAPKRLSCAHRPRPGELDP